VKDLSKYIEMLLDDTNLGAEYRVYFNGKIYVVNIYLKDIRYGNDFAQKHVKEWALSLIDTYFSKGSIECLINVCIDYIL
jgi:hypothetical protein